MDKILCPKCNKELNDYEINRLWCTNCNLKFKSLSELYESQTNIKQSAQNEITDDHKALIILACKDCVENHLKTPSTVNYITIDIKDYDDYGRVFLYVELDAQNSFGAYIRTKLYVVLQNVNDNGSYIALNEAVYKISLFANEDVVKRLNKWNKPI